MRVPNAARALFLILQALTFTIVLATTSTPAQAQDGADTGGGLHLGTLNLSPVISWRSEYDDNIFHSASNPVSDTVSTLEGSTQLRGRVRRVELTGAGSASWVHYNKLTYQRGANVGASLKLDFLFNRVVPYVSTGYTSSNQRLNPEIDTLPRLNTSTLSAGSLVRIGGKTSLDISASRTNRDYYTSSEEFDGASPYSTLDRESRQFTLSLDQQVTTLTRLVVTGEMRQDLFESSMRRNADYMRLTTGFESDGRVKGYAHVGTRMYKPRDPSLPDSRGFFTTVGTNTTLFDRLVIGLGADRDMAPSYRTEAAYYESYGYDASATYAVLRSLKLSANMGRRFADYSYADTYSPSASAPLGMEFYKKFGTGISYTVGSRLTFNVWGTYLERTSSQVSRQYDGMTLAVGISHAF